MWAGVAFAQTTVGIGPSGDPLNPYSVSLLNPPAPTLHPSFDAALVEACIQQGKIGVADVVLLTNPVTDSGLNVDCATGVVSALQPVTVQ